MAVVSSPTEDVQRPLNPRKVRERRQTREEASREGLIYLIQKLTGKLCFV